MKDREKPPTRLGDFKGKSPRVEVIRDSKDEGDIAATKALLIRYTQDDGFHCPRCDAVIKKPEEAIAHLAEEINKGMERLGR